tara:strand:+ start:3743 stop:3967 length:225 start_codon:yes stop_codon:yes gene_type:complete
MLDDTLVDGPSRIHVQHDDETRLSLTEAQSVVDLNAIQPEMNGQSKNQKTTLIRLLLHHQPEFLCGPIFGGTWA